VSELGSPSSTSSIGTPHTPPTPLHPRDDRLILVADDNVVNRKILSRILTSLNFTPVMAADGVQAVEAVKASPTPFFCVFMDISMPHLDGYEATRHIRALGSTVPIIALTANALSEERVKALSSGMDGFQTKPLRKVELAKLLHSMERGEGMGKAALQPKPSSAAGRARPYPASTEPPSRTLALSQSLKGVGAGGGGPKPNPLTENGKTQGGGSESEEEEKHGSHSHHHTIDVGQLVRRVLTAQP
jgi:CheY-like chemotaxis protein